jgi:hypothetical protein
MLDYRGFDSWKNTKVQNLWGLPTILFSIYRDPFLGAKQPRHEFDCSPLRNVEVNTECNYASIPLTCLHRIDRKEFTFVTKIFYSLLKIIRLINASRMKFILNVVHITDEESVINFSRKPTEETPVEWYECGLKD